MHECSIEIIADNTLSGTMYLTQEEIRAFRKVINGLQADGPWTPIIHIVDLTDQREKVEAEKRLQEEEHRKIFEEECSHLGKYSIRDKYPDLVKQFA